MPYSHYCSMILIQTKSKISYLVDVLEKLCRIVLKNIDFNAQIRHKSEHGDKLSGKHDRSSASCLTVLSPRSQTSKRLKLAITNAYEVKRL